MTELARPHANRRRHQQVLARHRRQRIKRRMARVHRLRVFRTIRSLRFWTRFCTFTIGLVAVAFWAKFAVVYNIPDYAHRGTLAHVDMYVTVKPWWFGPPAFDLSAYEVASDNAAALDHYSVLLEELGKYSAVVENPQFIWVAKQ